MCNWVMQETGEELQSEGGIKETMFSTLVSPDSKRKWSLWQIAAPSAAFLTQADGATAPLNFGTGRYTSQILRLDPEATSDVGAPINGLYTTAGLPDAATIKQQAGLGSGRVRWSYLTAQLAGEGNILVRALPNTLTPNNPYTVTGNCALSPNPQELFEAPLNTVGNRVFYEFSTDAVTEWFSLSTLKVFGMADAWAPIRGAISG
jgi:hypothetical protein